MFQYDYDISETEKFRARRRHICREQQTLPEQSIEASNTEEWHNRKISASQRHNQQQTHICDLFDYSCWSESAGTEMYQGLNAFDFSASPEAFHDGTAFQTKPLYQQNDFG